MITGDSLLTSLHVAKKVHICNTSLPVLTLSLRKDGATSTSDANISDDADTDSSDDKSNNIKNKKSTNLKIKKYTIDNFTWTIYDEAHNREIENYLPLNLDGNSSTPTSNSTNRISIDDDNSIIKLALKYNLVTTEETFLLAINATGGKASKLWTFAGRDDDDDSVVVDDDDDDNG